MHGMNRLRTTVGHLLAAYTSTFDPMVVETIRQAIRTALAAEKSYLNTLHDDGGAKAELDALCKHVKDETGLILD